MNAINKPQGGTMKPITPSFFLFVIAAFASAVFTDAAQAGRYELIKGKGVEVCEAYKKNFESFDNSRPMACEQQYSPSVKGFTIPPWQKLDLKKYLELFRKAELYTITGYVPKGEDEEIAKSRAGLADDKTVELYLLRIDLNGNGKKLTNVLAVRDVGCGPHPETEKAKKTRLYILKDSLTDINYERQERWSGFYNNSTIMLYKGKPYIVGYWPEDGWGNLFTKRGNFYVRDTSSLICNFEYIPSGEKSSAELFKQLSETKTRVREELLLILESIVL